MGLSGGSTWMQSEDRESGKGHLGWGRHRQVSPESLMADFPDSLLTWYLNIYRLFPVST